MSLGFLRRLGATKEQIKEECDLVWSKLETIRMINEHIEEIKKEEEKEIEKRMSNKKDLLFDPFEELNPK